MISPGTYSPKSCSSTSTEFPQTINIRLSDLCGVLQKLWQERRYSEVGITLPLETTHAGLGEAIAFALDGDKRRVIFEPNFRKPDGSTRLGRMNFCFTKNGGKEAEGETANGKVLDGTVRAESVVETNPAEAAVPARLVDKGRELFVEEPTNKEAGPAGMKKEREMVTEEQVERTGTIEAENEYIVEEEDEDEEYGSEGEWIDLVDTPVVGHLDGSPVRREFHMDTLGGVGGVGEQFVLDSGLLSSA
ncbi:MAG: hypothetical protein MMC33_003620 [Icmadophila ericetorum]|nr:hypothetical protein [Icmadophila ericetorum]